MAEMYVYKGPHWMDEPGIYEAAHLKIDNDTVLTAEQKVKSKDILTQKYNVRYSPGDVVQVMEDGTMWDKEKNDWKFENHNPMSMFVKLDGISCEDARAKYMEAYYDPASIENPKLLARRKIRLMIETASPQELADMENMRVVLSSIAEEDKSI